MVCRHTEKKGNTEDHLLLILYIKDTCNWGCNYSYKHEVLKNCVATKETITFSIWATLNTVGGKKILAPSYYKTPIPRSSKTDQTHSSKCRLLPALTLKESERIYTWEQYTGFIYLYSWPLKLGPMGCPENSVRIYHYKLCNNPEQRSSQCKACFATTFCVLNVSWPEVLWKLVGPYSQCIVLLVLITLIIVKYKAFYSRDFFLMFSFQLLFSQYVQITQY